MEGKTSKRRRDKINAESKNQSKSKVELCNKGKKASQRKRTKPGLRLTLPTCRGRRRKLILVNRADKTMKTSHNVVNAPDYNSVPGVLEEHLERPLCKSMTNYDNLTR